MKKFFKFYALPILAGLSLIAATIATPILVVTAPSATSAALLSVATVIGGLFVSTNCMLSQHTINRIDRINKKGYTQEELIQEQKELDEQAEALAKQKEKKVAKQVAKQEKKAIKKGQTKKAVSDIENSNEETNAL